MPILVADTHLEDSISAVLDEINRLRARVKLLEETPPGSTPVSLAQVAIASATSVNKSTWTKVPMASSPSLPSWCKISSGDIALTSEECLIIADLSVDSRIARSNVQWRLAAQLKHGGNYARVMNGHNEAGDTVVATVKGAATVSLEGQIQARAGTVTMAPASSRVILLRVR